MSSSDPLVPARWRQWLLASPWRTGLLFWTLFLGINNTVASLSVVEDYARRQLPLAAWEPFCWEFSSGLVLLILIPGVGWVLNQIPLDPRRWPAKLPTDLAAHLAASVVFSLLHVLLMVTLRNIIYAAAGMTYDFGVWGSELIYEYRKDVVTYFTIAVLLSVYRHYRQEHSAAPPPMAPAHRSDRLMIKKRGREYLVKIEEIEWAQACGNYVTLHKEGELHPLRSTMAALEQRLPENFCRVHRSAIVNLDQIAEISPQGSGDHIITLQNGAKVPFSRRYREAVKHHLGSVA
ncbi:MAG: LytR/AlgR family response regulator transcription factor [Lysobacterales bacterium]